MKKLMNPGNKKKKWPFIAVTVLLLAGGAGAAYWQFQRADSTPNAAKTVEQPLTENTDDSASTIRFIATGDMLPHDTVNKAAKTDSGYDYTPLFKPVHSFLTDADMSYCNQESPSAPSFGVTGYPTFNAPPAFADALHKEGCSVINLANNHTNDKGQAGINETRAVWDGYETLAVSGSARSTEEQNTISYFDKKGVRFAFLSYTKCSNDNSLTPYGLNLLERSLTDKQIAEAKHHADMIIVGMHWCRENTTQQDTGQDEWAQYFADNGVDIVIGTGPHWLQPVKRLPKANGGETVVWFSLGNFLSTQEELNGLIGGIAVMDIDVATKTVTKLSFLPTYMHYEWTAAQQAASDYLARTNLALYPLDAASPQLAKTRLGTSVEAQTDRVSQLLNTFTKVEMLTSESYKR